MVATAGVSFHTDVYVFIGILGVVLGINCTVFISIAEVLVVTASGVVVNLVNVGCAGGICFGGIFEYSFLAVDSFVFTLLVS